MWGTVCGAGGMPGRELLAAGPGSCRDDRGWGAGPGRAGGLGDWGRCVRGGSGDAGEGAGVGAGVRKKWGLGGQRLGRCVALESCRSEVVDAQPCEYTEHREIKMSFTICELHLD